MRRRDLIKAVVGSTAVWPLAARAQGIKGMRRIGVLMAIAESDPEGQARLNAFRDELRNLGWSEGRNIRIDYRWATPRATALRTQYAKELVALTPDLILSHATPSTAALAEQTRTIPIIFLGVSDPVGSGLLQVLPGLPATSLASSPWSQR
jgi:putative tryptophan/tyrosine transport system substrate-binding protein